MLTAENITGLAKLADDAADFENILFEKFDGKVFKIGIKTADTFLEKYVPEEFWDEINEGVAGILQKDWVTAMKELYDLVGEILNKYVFPKLTKEG